MYTANGTTQHPADQLIRDLIQTRRRAAHEEIGQIIERMTAVPFDPRMIPVPTGLRGLSYLGRTVQDRDESAFLHLVKRVLDERQWAAGVTLAEYVGDLRSAVRQAEARLVVYAGRSGPIAATVSQTAAAVPAARRGTESLPLLLVVYSADRAALITGYQFSQLSRVRLPQEALWLK